MAPVYKFNYKKWHIFCTGILFGLNVTTKNSRFDNVVTDPTIQINGNGGLSLVNI